MPLILRRLLQTVRLSATPGEKQIKLEWTAEVPWSNVIDGDPWHYIYRGEDNESPMVLIDSVDVSEFGFEYVDTNEFGKQPLRDDILYCYYIVTRGTYGNSRIPLLLNSSQQVCVYTDSNLPPCTPVLSIANTDCDNFISADCLNENLYNALSWTVPETEGCRQDIISFRILVADSPDAELALLTENVTGFSYKDENLTSFARCYAIQSVGAKGLVSAPSQRVCNENCPSFELPNVFTPNGDGCNDVFAAINGVDIMNPDCPAVEPGKCPMFVKQVFLKVINRWGRVVYEYKSDAQNSIMINWNGEDRNGNLLEAGVYYYTADVEFEAMDPALQKKRMKGTIHLVR